MNPSCCSFELNQAPEVSHQAENAKVLTVRDEPIPTEALWKLQCPAHSSLVLAERRPHSCGTILFHPVCPLCIQEEVLRDSPKAINHLQLLTEHYREILEKSEVNAPPLRRLVSELQDLKEDMREFLVDIDTSDYERRFSKALVFIDKMLKGKTARAKPTILEQIRSLEADLEGYNGRLSALDAKSTDRYKSTLVSATKDVLGQLVGLDLVRRQDEILTCNDPQAVFSEFAKLQSCMVEVTSSLSQVSLKKRGRKVARDIMPQVEKHGESPRLDSIPECISIDDSSRAEDPVIISLPMAEEMHPTVWKPSDELQPEWDQSTVVSSSCSSTDGTSVRNIVHRLKNCHGVDLSFPVYLECIDDWCLRDDIRGVEFAASGGIPAILHAMRAANEHPEMQAKACETLKYLASIKSNQPLIVVMGGVTAVLTAMSQYPNHVKIQTFAMGALKHLCGYEGTGDEIISEDGVDVILAAMQRHKDHAALQKHACAILESVDWTEVDPIAVSTLFSCIRCHPKEGELQAHAMKVLRHILQRNTDDASSGVRSAVEQIVFVLERKLAYKSFEFLDALQFCEMIPKDDTDKPLKVPITVQNPFNLKGHAAETPLLTTMSYRGMVADDDDNTIDSQDTTDPVVAPDMDPFDDDNFYKLVGWINEILGPLQQYLTHPVVQQIGLNALNALLIDEMSAFAFLRTDGVNVILESMSEHPEESDILEVGCTILADVVSIDECGDCSLHASQIREAVLFAMEQHPHHCNIHRRACFTLKTLAENTTQKELIIEDNGIDRVLSTMMEHSEHRELQENGLSLLWELSVSSDHKCGDEIVDANGIDIIMAVLLLHPTYESIQEDGCDILLHAVKDDPFGQATEKQKEDVCSRVLQEYISQMTTGDNSTMSDAITMAQYHQWLRTLVDTLENGASGPVLDSCAMKVLRILTVNHAIQDALLSLKGIEAVVVALRTYPTHEILQSYGIGFFCDLSMDECRRSPLVAAGVTDPIMLAMKQHPDSVRVYQPACATLCNISNHEKTRRDLILAGGVTIALYAMERHPTVASIQEDCCGLLWNMALDEVGLDRTIAEGGIARILRAMRQFPDRSLLQGDACGALLSIVRNQVGFDNQLLMEISDATESAIEKHGDVEVVQYYGGLLSTLAAQAWDSSSSVSSESTLEDTSIASASSNDGDIF
jgi:hypothetical protein